MIILKNGTVINPETGFIGMLDVVVEDGLIKTLAPDIDT